MNTDVSKVVASLDVANRAMKFRLSRGGTSKRIRDKSAEAQVASDTGEDGWIVSRSLFQDKDSLVYKYQALGNEMYQYHIKATLPFGDDSSRLLPNAKYFEYTSEMQTHISKMDQMKNLILNDWVNIVQKDVDSRNATKALHGKPQDAAPSEYPSRQQMDERLYVQWYPEPISTSGDFRFVQSDEMTARFASAMEEAVKEAGRDLYVRMLTPVTSFINKLNTYTGEKGQRFANSFLENLNSLSADLPKLNINDDPEVTRLLAEIDTIVKPYVFAPDALKENQANRDAIKAKLEQLEAQIKGYTL